MAMMECLLSHPSPAIQGKKQYSYRHYCLSMILLSVGPVYQASSPAASQSENREIKQAPAPFQWLNVGQMSLECNCCVARSKTLPGVNPWKQVTLVRMSDWNYLENPMFT